MWGSLDREMKSLAEIYLYNTYDIILWEEPYLFMIMNTMIIFCIIVSWSKLNNAVGIHSYLRICTYLILTTCLNLQGNLDTMKIDYIKKYQDPEIASYDFFHDKLFKKSTKHKIVVLGFHNMKTEA